MQPESPSVVDRVSIVADRPKSINRLGNILPIVAISGALGKTSTGWLLVHALEATGIAPAAWLSDGVFIDHEVRHDELRAWELATLATRARELDILIQEIPSVLATSLPESSIWIGVLTAICGTDDQCRRDSATEFQREAIERVAGAVHPSGTLIANADDLLIADVAQASDRDVMLFALNFGNPVLQSHLSNNGDAIWIQNGWVKTHVSGETYRVIKVSALPSTLDGHLIFQVQNALAAVATVLKCSRDSNLMSSRLRTSFGSRCYLGHKGTQIRAYRRRTTIIDVPRSLLAIKQIVRAIRAIGPRRVVLRLGPMMDLDESEVSEASRVLGSLGGIALLPSDPSSPERLDLITEGLMTSSNPPAIAFRANQNASLTYVESLLEDGDIALFLDDLP